jgi:hypothetical protein
MGRKTTGRDRLAIGGVVLAVAVALFAADLARAGWFVVLSLGVPYLAFMFPFHCREETQQHTACTLPRSGWLIGCGHHRWRRLRRLASTISGGLINSRAQPLGGASNHNRPTRTHRGSTGHASAPIPPAGPSRPWYDGLILITALISAATGVIQVL